MNNQTDLVRHALRLTQLAPPRARVLLHLRHHVRRHAVVLFNLFDERGLGVRLRHEVIVRELRGGVELRFEELRREAQTRPSNMLGGASQIVSKIRMKCNGT